MVLRQVSLAAVAVLVTLAAARLTTTDPLMALVLGAVMIGLCGLMMFGPDRFGGMLMVAGMFLAPQNDIRPIASSLQLNFGDVFLAAGLVLLFPRMLRREVRVPTVFAVGALILFVTSLTSSLATDTPLYAVALGVRMVLASIALPIGFLFWGPSDTRVKQLAWAYVAGHLMSTVVGLVEGPLAGRYIGTTYHANFFATAAVLSLALLPHLWATSGRAGRWAVMGAGLVTAYSVHLSGSRGALLALVALAVVFPLLERSVMSGYVLIAGFMTMIPLLGMLVSAASPDSAIGRLAGKDETTSGSNDVREDALSDGWDRLMQHPILGSGYVENLVIHNIFLQVAVAVGVIGFVGWALMLGKLTVPLLGTHPLRRLSYVGLAYLGIGLTEPLLWDRVVWAPLALALVATVIRPSTTAREAAPPDDEGRAPREAHLPRHA